MRFMRIKNGESSKQMYCNFVLHILCLNAFIYPEVRSTTYTEHGVIARVLPKILPVCISGDNKKYFF